MVADPEIHHGEPCIAGTRIPVRMIVGSLADGLTIEQIVAEYPQLMPEDVSAALSYAAEAALDALRETQRLGFLEGEIAVPEDFNHMGEAEIAALFVSRSGKLLLGGSVHKV